MGNTLLSVSDSYTILLFIKLTFGAAAVFFSILLWRKTQRFSVKFFILGIFSLYVSILYQILKHLGFITITLFEIYGLQTDLIFFEVIPIIFFIAAQCSFLKSDF